MSKERNEETYHRLSWAEFEERYGESPADFEEERDKRLYQLECEDAGENY